MKHRDFINDYEEIARQERDVILGFLYKQANLCYGNQMFEYCLNDIVLHNDYGIEFKVRCIRVKDNDVIFDVVSTFGNHLECTCLEFAFGELSKLIDILPEPDEINKKQFEFDMSLWSNGGKIKLSTPFKWTDKDNHTYELHSIFKDGGNVMYEVKGCDGDNDWGLWNGLPDDIKVAEKMRDYVASDILHNSEEYKAIKKTLGSHGYNFVENGEFPSVMYQPFGTDIELPILDIDTSDNQISILVSIKDTRLEIGDADSMTINEYQIDPKSLKPIVDFFSHQTIMDDKNGHNKELVKEINNLWKVKSNRTKFNEVLYLLGEEFKTDYENQAGNVVPENPNCVTDSFACEFLSYICDDFDLQTIINYVNGEIDSLEYSWVASSDDGCFEDKSKATFKTRKDAYNDMRDSALEKMKWNTQYDDDFFDGTDIGYKVTFSRDRISHESYSGLYTYKILRVK